MNSRPDLFAGRHTAVTITCHCGHAESFEGDVLSSIQASQDSQRWFLNSGGFFTCEGCAKEPTPAGCRQSQENLKMAVVYCGDELIGSLEFDRAELNTLKPEDWLRLIHECDPCSEITMVKTPEGNFKLFELVNGDVVDTGPAGQEGASA